MPAVPPVSRRRGAGPAQDTCDGGWRSATARPWRPSERRGRARSSSAAPAGREATATRPIAMVTSRYSLLPCSSPSNPGTTALPEAAKPNPRITSPVDRKPARAQVRRQRPTASKGRQRRLQGPWRRTPRLGTLMSSPSLPIPAPTAQRVLAGDLQRSGPEAARDGGQRATGLAEVKAHQASALDAALGAANFVQAE